VVGIFIVAVDCGFASPGFGVLVLGLGTIAFGIGNWVLEA